MVSDQSSRILLHPGSVRRARGASSDKFKNRNFTLLKQRRLLMRERDLFVYALGGFAFILESL